MKKVTKYLAVISLAILVFALGFAAKHGQFEPSGQHGHFLAKAVKMETPAHHSQSSDVAVVPLIALSVSHLVPLYRPQPLSLNNFPIITFPAHPLPLLV